MNTVTNLSVTWDNMSNFHPIMNASNVTLDEQLLCSKSFRQLVLTHRDLRAKIELSILVIGAIANIVNVIVLTRRNMKTATNFLLTGLAVADFLLLANEIPLYSFFVYDQDSVYYPYGWASYLAFETVSKFVFNTASSWMTVLIGIWRNLVVYRPLQKSKLCSKKRTLNAIGIVYLISVIMNIPIMLITSVDRIVSDDSNLTNNYLVNFRGCKTLLAFQVIIVFNRTVPVLAVTVLCVLLIRAIRKANVRRKRMASTTFNPTAFKSDDEKSNKVTITLLSVIVVFFITHVVIGLIFVTDFFYPLAQFIPVTNLFMFINSSVNIILYSITSEDYRRTFAQILGFEKVTKLASRVWHTSTTTTTTASGSTLDTPM